MTDAPLANWIRAGDLRRAGEWLVRAHAADVVALCTAMLRDRAAAEDAAQEVFSQAFEHLAGFRGDASPRTWLLAIARNRCIDTLRARKRDPWAGASDDDEPDQHADVAPLPAALLAARADVEAALAALGEGERALVVLRFKNGLEVRELAEAFGLREGTVRMRLSRALGRMRAALETPPHAAPVVQAAAAPAVRRLAGGPPPLAAAPPAGRPLAPPAGAIPPAPARAPMAPRRAVDPFAAALARSGYDASPALVARLGALVASLPAG